MSRDIKTGYGKYIWITGGATGTATLLGIFYALFMLGLSPVCSEVTVCDELHCEFYCNVTNPTYKSVYLFNHDDLPLKFSPEVENFTLYAKYYGKWRFTNFTRETRFPNIPDDRKYVFVFPSRATKEFKVVIDMKDANMIKYDFGSLDPYLIGWNEIYNVKSKVVPDKIEMLTKKVCWYNDETLKGGCDYYNHTYENVINWKVEYVNTTVSGLKVGDKNFIGDFKICGDYLVKYHVNSEGRNTEEFCRCLPHEIRKGTCSEKLVINSVMAK